MSTGAGGSAALTFPHKSNPSTQNHDNIQSILRPEPVESHLQADKGNLHR
jgi:hypothetical protein